MHAYGGRPAGALYPGTAVTRCGIAPSDEIDPIIALDDDLVTCMGCRAILLLQLWSARAVHGSQFVRDELGRATEEFLASRKLDTE